MGKALCWGAGRPTPGSVSRASRDGPLGSPPPSPREMPPSMSSSGPCPLLLERVPPAGHQCPNATPGEHHAPHHSHSGNFKIFFLCFYYGTFQKLVLKKKKKKKTCTITQLQNLSSLFWASLVTQLVKNPPEMQETWVLPLGWQDPLEKGTATHSSILAWRIPWTEEPGGCHLWGRTESDTTEAT